jgi:hypothetical protein
MSDILTEMVPLTADGRTTHGYLARPAAEG